MLQGSVLSPSLFSIYVNFLLEDLEKVAGKDSVYAYADDIMVNFYGKVHLRKVIKVVEEWSNTNKMQINKSKSGFMFIGKSS